MSHNTVFGGVSREIEGGTPLIGGVAREIESGLVLAGGVAREIEFGDRPGTIVLSGQLSGWLTYIAVNGTEINTAGTYEYTSPLTLLVSCYATKTYSTATVTLNGSTVYVRYGGKGTYTFTTESKSITVNYRRTGLSNEYDYHADITTQ